MRIRKHSKMSTALFLSSCSSLSSDTLLNPHLCLLNQSPWDVIDFSPSDSSTPPPFHQSPQLDGNESFNGNGTLVDSGGAVESVDSMKLALEAEGTNCGEEEDREEKKRGENLCCKTDGKQWQCKKETRKNQTMCDYHLDQIKNYNTLAHPSIAKSSSSNKPARAGKASTASLSNPNDFYYYSGFGPRWGKKRDPIVNSSSTNKREKVSVQPAKVTAPPPPCYTSTEIFDDDDDDDEEENSVSGMKRRRKPIKARSLKDLCEGMC